MPDLVLARPIASSDLLWSAPRAPHPHVAEERTRGLCTFGRRGARLCAPHDGLQASLITGGRQPQHFQRLLDREGAGPLTWWKLHKARQMLADDPLRRDDHKRVLNEPSHVIAGLVLRPLERIGAQIEQHGQPQLYHRLLPYSDAFGLLLKENSLPLIVTEAGQVAVVGPVEELSALVRALGRQQIALVISVEMNLEVLARRNSLAAAFP